MLSQLIANSGSKNKNMEYSFLFTLFAMCSTSSSLHADVKLKSSGIMYIPSPTAMDYNEGLNFCKYIGGILAEPRTESEIEDIDDSLDANNHYWIGL